MDNATAYDPLRNQHVYWEEYIQEPLSYAYINYMVSGIGETAPHHSPLDWILTGASFGFLY